MKAAPLLLSASILCTGCLTGSTIAAAKESVKYQPQTGGDEKITPLEVELVEKAKPAYSALVPFAAVADLALRPVSSESSCA